MLRICKLISTQELHTKRTKDDNILECDYVYLDTLPIFNKVSKELTYEEYLRKRLNTNPKFVEHVKALKGKTLVYSCEERGYWRGRILIKAVQWLHDHPGKLPTYYEKEQN